jgi:hypothetical protein
MIRSLTLLALLVMALASSASEPAAPPYFVDSWLEPAQAVPGQKMVLNLKIGVDTYFTRAAKFSLPEMEQALVLLNSQAINSGESRHGKRYATQLWEIDIYPNRAGILMVPAITLGFSRAPDSESAGEDSAQRVEVVTEQLLGLVAMPAAMKGLSGFMVSSDVEIDDQWTPPQGKQSLLRGDVIQRVITIEAKDMTAMNMPQINPQTPRGVSVTLAEPSLSSSNGRDGPSARMEQHISYAIEKPGRYKLGGEAISWWNPQQSQRVNYQFDSKPVDAGGVPWQLLGAALAGLVLLLLAGLACRRYLRQRDLREVAIKKRLRDLDAGKRLAALYAYADYHNPAASEAVQLRKELACSRALVAKVLQARFSSATDNDSPSVKETRQLFRQSRKKLS